MVHANNIKAAIICVGITMLQLAGYWRTRNLTGGRAEFEFWAKVRKCTGFSIMMCGSFLLKNGNNP
jgi:hypothetical protein